MVPENHNNSPIIRIAVTLRRQIGDASTMDDMADLIGEARGKKYFDEFRVLMAAFEAEELRLMAIRQTARGETVQLTYIAIATFTGIVMLVGLILARLIGHSIATPLLETTRAVERLAHSNRRVMLPDTGRSDEVGSLIKAFNTMARRLHEQDVIVASEIEVREIAENKAKDANKAKSEFLSNMSHELRTPLNSILILSKLLYENKDGNLTDRQAESASIINSSGNDLLTLIDNILDLSKVEAGKIELIFEKVEIKEQTDILLRQFYPLAKEKGLDLIVNISDKLESEFRTDSQRLLQILKNLFSNAVKFTSSGSVTLDIGHPGNVKFQKLNLPREQIIAFSVEDTGIGISPEIQSEIFNAFQQADGTINRIYGGTGLGLTISREFASLLGGELHLSKSSEIGCVFTLYLPFNAYSSQHDQATFNDSMKRLNPEVIIQPSIENNSATDIPANDRTDDKVDQKFNKENVHILEKCNNTTSGDSTSIMHSLKDSKKHKPIEISHNTNKKSNYFDNKKVLLVDDDMRNIFALSNVLSDAGLKVEAANNGQLALDKLDNMNDISIVLMDIMMPVMDGLEAIRRIRGQSKFKDLPVIALTAKAMEQDQIECLNAGANHYLTKPVDTEKLLSLMHSSLYDKTG